jgi:hypothetical protein
MTAIPTEKTDNSREDLASLENDSNVSPEELAERLRGKVEGRVSDFHTNIAEHLEAMKAWLDPGEISPTGEELTRLAQTADALGKKTIREMDRVIGEPNVPSGRFLRALGRSPIETPSTVPVVIENEIEIAHTLPKEEVVWRTEEKQSSAPQESAPIFIERIRESNAEVVRLKRDLALAESVEKLESNESLGISDIERIAGALTSRGWQELLSTVKSGDAVVTFLVPNAEHFSIKHFNDVLFGPQKTDTIIALYRDRLHREMRASGAERVATSYKDAYYRLPKDRFTEDGTDQSVQRLSEATERVRESVTIEIMEMATKEWESGDEKRKNALDAFVRAMIGEESSSLYIKHRMTYLASCRVWKEAIEEKMKARQEYEACQSNDSEILRPLNEKVREAEESVFMAQRLMDAERVEIADKIVKPALEKNPHDGYRITFGLSVVGEADKKKDSVAHIERSVSEALKGAMKARRTKEIGGVFSKEYFFNEVIPSLERLRSRIGIRELADAEGRVYPVFDVNADGSTVINLDLIREVRKGTFIPLADFEQADLFRDVKAYIDQINILDVTKPYTYEEISGGYVNGTDRSIVDFVKETNELVLSLRNGEVFKEGHENGRNNIVKILRHDGKDRTCTSAMEFHRQALKISNCSYISLDVLDVGPELLQEYESLIQRVAKHPESFEEVQSIAGDVTTKRMRAFRARVTEICREHSPDLEPIISVGGDEVVLAMDSARVTDAFILKLRGIRFGDDRSEGSVRVVRTVVGSSERISESDGDERETEHLQAMRRAEEGTGVAKEIEKHLRGIRICINDLPPEERNLHLDGLKHMNLSDFAVHECDDGGFELIVPDPNDRLKTVHVSLEKKMEELRSSLEGLKTLIRRRRSDFFERHSSTYSKLTSELVPIVLRRYDRWLPEKREEELVHFMQLFQ